MANFPSSKTTIAFIVSFLCSLFAFLRLSTLSTSDTLKQLPTDPNVGRQLPTIGVGFDLTASYGTVALSFPNGTITPISKVEGDAAYHEVLARLSLESSTHPTPPYNNYGEELRDRPRQVERQRRKANGLPASDDVAALSNMTSHLRAVAEDRLGQPVSHVLISTPNLIALYDEDMEDALEYLGLKPADPGLKVQSLWETITAYAGHGLGLCSNYRNISDCQEEQSGMPDEEVMAVLFTRTALTVSLSSVKSAYGLWEPPYRRITDFDLGLDARDDNPDGRYYWEAVKDRLREIMVKNQYYKRPDKVLLFGETSGNADFRKVLGASLSSVMEKMPTIFHDHALFAPAMGAAEFAKRGLWKEAHVSASRISIDQSVLEAQVREGL